MPNSQPASPAAAPLDDPVDTDVSLRALAHPVRRQLMRLVRRDERSVGALARELGLSQPSTSQHLRVLRDANLVSARTDANRRFYLADADGLASVQSALAVFWDDRLASLTDHAEDVAVSDIAAETFLRPGTSQESA